MQKKKTFFREATKAEIKKKKIIAAELPDLLDVADCEAIIVDSLVPRGYDSSRKFMKHGLEVKPKRYYSLDHALREGKTPVQLREKAFNDISDDKFCGYSFVPLGKDGRKRKVSLIECLEGARIFSYSHQVNGADIKIRPYVDSKRVRKDGASIVCSVPSRTQKQPKIPVKLLSVPVIDSSEKYVISLGIGSEHSCPSKRFNIRYRYLEGREGSGIVNVCAHEIAAYLGVIEHFWDKKNIIPLQMSQYAIPTQETVDYYLKLGNSVLIRDESLKNKDKLRKPNIADKEIALWNLVRNLGHDKTFYSKSSRDGNVADYNWQIK